MAVYKLFPLQDATLYSFYPYMNTGIDPIIEVGNINVNINSELLDKKYNILLL